MEKVKVYRNLHQKCWSVKTKGQPVEHRDYIALKNVKFRVQLAGRKKVRQTGRKNVHAFAVGTPEDYNKIPFNSPHWKQIKYNPYTMESFETIDGCKIYQAPLVYFDSIGEVFVSW